MYKILKYKWEDRHKHKWSSDWHIFHDPKWVIPIWESRGYKSAADAAEKIAEQINKSVKEDDILWFLGDMFLNASDEQCLEWLSKIKCKNIHVLWGNHESNMYRLYKQEVKRQFNLDDAEVYPLRMGNVVFMGNHLEIQIGKKKICMNHFPMRIWNKSHHNSWMLSGHSHLNDAQRRPDFPLAKAMDAGWDWKNDVWTFDELEDVMSTKTVELIDHHDHSTT